MAVVVPTPGAITVAVHRRSSPSLTQPLPGAGLGSLGAALYRTRKPCAGTFLSTTCAIGSGRIPLFARTKRAARPRKVRRASAQLRYRRTHRLAIELGVLLCCTLIL